MNCTLYEEKKQYCHLLDTYTQKKTNALKAINDPRVIEILLTSSVVQMQ